MRKMVLSLLVTNESGVLSRIAGLFTRRGYNIDSITAGETQDPSLTRMTVATSGDDIVLEQIVNQLKKLVDVKEIVELPADGSVCRELILVRIAATAMQRPEVMSVANIFRANIVDVAPDSMMIEITGNQSKLDAFLNLLDGYEILSLARTGLAGLLRGTASDCIDD